MKALDFILTEATVDAKKLATDVMHIPDTPLDVKQKINRPFSTGSERIRRQFSDGTISRLSNNFPEYFKSVQQYLNSEEDAVEHWREIDDALKNLHTSRVLSNRLFRSAIKDEKFKNKILRIAKLDTASGLPTNPIAVYNFMIKNLWNFVPKGIDFAESQEILTWLVVKYIKGDFSLAEDSKSIANALMNYISSNDIKNLNSISDLKKNQNKLVMTNRKLDYVVPRDKDSDIWKEISKISVPINGHSDYAIISLSQVNGDKTNLDSSRIEKYSKFENIDLDTSKLKNGIKKYNFKNPLVMVLVNLDKQEQYIDLVVDLDTQKIYAGTQFNKLHEINPDEHNNLNFGNQQFTELASNVVDNLYKLVGGIGVNDLLKSLKIPAKSTIFRPDAWDNDKNRKQNSKNT